MPRLAEAGRLREVPASGRVRDIGRLEELARARADMPRRPGAVRCFSTATGQSPPITAGSVRASASSGYAASVRRSGQRERRARVCSSSHESGVARSIRDEQAIRSLHAWMVDAVRCGGGTIEHIRYCPFYVPAALEAY